MTNATKVNLLFVVTLGILSMLPPLGIDMYLPAFLNNSSSIFFDLFPLIFITPITPYPAVEIAAIVLLIFLQ